MTIDGRPNRRGFLAAVGAAATLAGCTDEGARSEPRYEEGDAGAGGEERTPEEMAVAEALAVDEPGDSVTVLDALSLAEHEFVVQDGFKRATVQGTVENEGDDRVKTAEVRVRAYDAEGNHLGRYFDRTGDIDAGTSWSFEVIVLEAPDDVESYDIAVLGLPS